MRQTEIVADDPFFPGYHIFGSFAHVQTRSASITIFV
jgi:hypothetical protein